MIRKSQFRLLLIVITIFLSSKANAQFPYFEDFKKSTAPGVVFGGEPAAFLTAPSIDAEGDGYLRLTDNVQNQKGFIYSDRVFPSNFGLKVEFEYFTYGGNGADGITFFLFDATTSLFNIGGFGGSLGYAQINTTNPTSPGVSNGYIGIGLDEWGNFSNSNEGRQGGVGFRPSSLTLRGKGNGAAQTINNYKYLTSIQTADLAFSLTPEGSNTIRYPLPSQPGYRKVSINMKPNNETGGYDITVKIVAGGSTSQTYTLINNYNYPQAAPPTLKYGIASSTGLFKNYHEIRNVAVDVFDNSTILNPIAKNDLLGVCLGEDISLDITANDSVTNKNGAINKATIDLDPNSTGIQSSFPVSGKGTFSVNSAGLVKFLPINNTLTGTITAFYTVNDTYGKASDPGTIAVSIYAFPPAADAGRDTLIHKSSLLTSIKMAAVLPAKLSGKWSQISGPNTSIINNLIDNNNSLTISGLATGVYKFRWTITPGGTCSSFADVKVTVNDSPIAVDESITTAANTKVIIPILNNDTDANGNNTIDKTTVIIKIPQKNGTVTKLANGDIEYTPNLDYSGFDTLYYSIKDILGAESNSAKVIIGTDIRPKGTNDGLYIVNTRAILNVKENDPSKDGTSVINDTNPLHGTIIINPDKASITYTPLNGYYGNDSFTYLLENTDGATSAPILVSMYVNGIPVAVDDVILPFPPGKSVDIDVKVNDADVDGIIQNDTVIIKVPPLHGNAIIDSLTWKVSYTPNSGYSGPDNFTYLIKDDKGGESNIARVTLTINPPSKLGVAKSLSSLKIGLNSSYLLTFIFTLVNYGPDVIERISLIDDLVKYFPGTDFKITELSATGDLKINPGFNGGTDNELLLPTSTIDPLAKEQQVTLKLNMKLLSGDGRFENSAFVTGYSVTDGQIVTDQSTDGLKPDPNLALPGNITRLENTPVYLEKLPIFIPNGFSPNNDGINDNFVIQNMLDHSIDLQIYNRWGNKVYKSANYQNTWDGKCTEGIHIGEDVPAGTYYYIIKIDNERNETGFLTINR